jgi:hypothetical protein
MIETTVPRTKVGHSPSYGSLLLLKDGRLIWVWGTGNAKEAQPLHANLSDDGGATWGDPCALKLASGAELTGVFLANLLRLPSGGIGLVYTRSFAADARVHATAQAWFHVSTDEGESWSDGVRINPPETTCFLCNDRAFVLSDGRVIVPAYGVVGPTLTRPNPKSTMRFGERLGNPSWFGVGHSFAYYSDDEGRTWQRSRNEAVALLDEGIGGAFGMGEPAVVELKDGRLMMLARTELGRPFVSHSPDRGESWEEPQPSPLVSSAAPCSLERIPQTGDLLVIWNQIAPWETMTGLYRHRLSCAVSRDEGETWEHHKNLESLDDVSYVEPAEVRPVPTSGHRQPIDRRRYHRAPGPLRHSYPTCTFLDDEAVITYGRSVVGDPNVISGTYGMDFEDLVERLGFELVESKVKPRGNNRVRALPIEWFYA